MHPTNRVRELRKRAKMTQEDLGKAAGVSQEAISQIENDRRPLTIDWMRAFARIFGVSTAEILGDDDHPGRLSEEERTLLEHYRSANSAQRELVQRVAEPVATFGPAPADHSLGRRVA